MPVGTQPGACLQQVSAPQTLLAPREPPQHPGRARGCSVRGVPWLELGHRLFCAVYVLGMWWIESLKCRAGRRTSSLLSVLGGRSSARCSPPCYVVLPLNWTGLVAVTFLPRGSYYTLSNIWLWNYWGSSCSLTHQTTSVLSLTHELKYRAPFQPFPAYVPLIEACVDVTFRCKLTKHVLNFASFSAGKFRETKAYSLHPQGILLYNFSGSLFFFSFSKSLSLQPLPSGTPFLFLCISSTFHLFAVFQQTKCCLCCWHLLISSSLIGLMTRYLACLDIIAPSAVMDSILSWVIACWD